MGEDSQSAACWQKMGNTCIWCQFIHNLYSVNVDHNTTTAREEEEQELLLQLLIVFH